MEDIENVGDKSDIVTVKDGYGRNFLIPKKLAIIANEDNLKRLDEYKAREAAKVAERIGEIQAIADKLEGQILKVGAKAGTSGKIFGSVTNLQIAAALKEQLDIEVDRRKVVLPEDIKELGTYAANLDLHPEVETIVRFELVAD